MSQTWGIGAAAKGQCTAPGRQLAFAKGEADAAAVVVGEVVAAGVPAAVVADFSGWLVETTDLIERDVVGVAAGFPAEVRVDALPDVTLSGAVRSIGGIARDVRGDTTYPIAIQLDDTAGVPCAGG